MTHSHVIHSANPVSSVLTRISRNTLMYIYILYSDENLTVNLQTCVMSPLGHLVYQPKAQTLQDTYPRTCLYLFGVHTSPVILSWPRKALARIHDYKCFLACVASHFHQSYPRCRPSGIKRSPE